MPDGCLDGGASAAVNSDSTGAENIARASSCSKASGGGAAAGSMKKGPWTAAEDAILTDYVRRHGEGNWNAVQRNSGLSRCGKSCRLRWANHLRPNLRKGPFSPEEERLILELHAKLGNKWARMAAQLPGRTDNEIKNYWNTRIKRRQRAGLPLYPLDIQRQAALHHHHRPSPGAAPLSLFDHTEFGVAPTVGTSSHMVNTGHCLSFIVPSPAGETGLQQRGGGFPDGGVGGFSMAFSSNTVTPPHSQNAVFLLDALGAYDLGSPSPQHNRQSFSVKMELPSSQFFPEAPTLRSESDLLDSLLLDGEAVVAGGGSADECGNAGGDYRRGRNFLPEPTAENVSYVNGNAGGGNCSEHPQGLILGDCGGKWDYSKLPLSEFHLPWSLLVISRVLASLFQELAEDSTSRQSCRNQGPRQALMSALYRLLILFSRRCEEERSGRGRWHG
ncbi:unnamed protein product [Spirodela intermedia]|uniref:Transcription factor GAMYB n=1 Tax=Spirodela intermedia TaxID=51605 RepID=A0A7I8KVF4_SPIIN|nr:unnamed protein product [Spirodela intermedia]